MISVISNPSSSTASAQPCDISNLEEFQGLQKGLQHSKGQGHILPRPKLMGWIVLLHSILVAPRGWKHRVKLSLKLPVLSGMEPKSSAFLNKFWQIHLVFFIGPMLPKKKDKFKRALQQEMLLALHLSLVNCIRSCYGLLTCSAPGWSQ